MHEWTGNTNLTFARDLGMYQPKTSSAVDFFSCEYATLAWKAFSNLMFDKGYNDLLSICPPMVQESCSGLNRFIK
jgi:hypothetical protein